MSCEALGFLNATLKGCLSPGTVPPGYMHTYKMKAQETQLHSTVFKTPLNSTESPPAVTRCKAPRNSRGVVCLFPTSLTIHFISINTQRLWMGFSGDKTHQPLLFLIQRVYPWGAQCWHTWCFSLCFKLSPVKPNLPYGWKMCANQFSRPETIQSHVEGHSWKKLQPIPYLSLIFIYIH